MATRQDGLPFSRPDSSPSQTHRVSLETKPSELARRDGAGCFRVHDPLRGEHESAGRLSATSPPRKESTCVGACELMSREVGFVCTVERSSVTDCSVPLWVPIISTIIIIPSSIHLISDRLNLF